MKKQLQSLIKQSTFGAEGSSSGPFVAGFVLGIVAAIFIGTVTIKKPKFQ